MLPPPLMRLSDDCDATGMTNAEEEVATVLLGDEPTAASKDEAGHTALCSATRKLAVPAHDESASPPALPPPTMPLLDRPRIYVECDGAGCTPAPTGLGLELPSKAAGGSTVLTAAEGWACRWLDPALPLPSPPQSPPPIPNMIERGLPTATESRGAVGVVVPSGPGG